VRETIVPVLSRKGIRVFGVIPSDRILRSISVADIAEIIGGEVLCSEEFLDKQAEKILIGAMNLEKSYSYFKRYRNKAVIVGGDRADIQLAALETSTACVILTGGYYPNDIILAKADDADIPLILVKEDTFSAVNRLDHLFGRMPLNTERKVKRGSEIVQKEMDWRALKKTLEL